MQNQYHILNGDALKMQFPSSISGKILVMKECLIDGDVRGKTLSEFYQNRATYLSKTYKGSTNYFQKVVPEFQKMMTIPDGCTINLWFEYDLFCQVNLWFVLYLLKKHTNSMFLILPNSKSPYGFGEMNKTELKVAYEKKLGITLSERDLLNQLWKYYQQNNIEQLLSISAELGSKYQFLIPAIKAHQARLPNKNQLGRPKVAILEIMKDLGTKDFGLVFREFCKREGIYGFGDLQVKRIFDEVIHLS